MDSLVSSSKQCLTTPTAIRIRFGRDFAAAIAASATKALLGRYSGKEKSVATQSHCKWLSP